LLDKIKVILTKKQFGESPGREGRQTGEAAMTTRNELSGKHCQSCEGGVPPLVFEQIQQHLKALPDWKLTADSKRIRREWRVKDFVTGLSFFTRIGALAEAEDHHPDLHLTGYRNVAIEIWTHAIGGLSENDFILAAKIDQLPVELKI
jgi:4a-hydroxytetrahydrobiopterin dehydratase